MVQTSKFFQSQQHIRHNFRTFVTTLFTQCRTPILYIHLEQFFRTTVTQTHHCGQEKRGDEKSKQTLPPVILSQSLVRIFLTVHAVFLETTSQGIVIHLQNFIKHTLIHLPRTMEAEKGGQIQDRRSVPSQREIDEHTFNFAVFVLEQRIVHSEVTVAKRGERFLGFDVFHNQIIVRAPQFILEFVTESRIVSPPAKIFHRSARRSVVNNFQDRSLVIPDLLEIVHEIEELFTASLLRHVSFGVESRDLSKRGHRVFERDVVFPFADIVSALGDHVLENDRRVGRRFLLGEHASRKFLVVFRVSLVEQYLVVELLVHSHYVTHVGYNGWFLQDNVHRSPFIRVLGIRVYVEVVQIRDEEGIFWHGYLVAYVIEIFAKIRHYFVDQRIQQVFFRSLAHRLQLRGKLLLWIVVTANWRRMLLKMVL